MSERKVRKSLNKQVSQPSGPNGTKAPRELGLAKALEEVAKSLPTKYSVDDWAIERLILAYKNAHSQKTEGTRN
jgi:hypothetical protein